MLPFEIIHDLSYLPWIIFPFLYYMCYLLTLDGNLGVKLCKLMRINKSLENSENY